MAHLRRNEHLKLVANCCNTLATTVFTLGILTPMADRIWKEGNPTQFSAIGLFATCFCLAIASHLLGQWSITGLKDTDDE